MDPEGELETLNVKLAEEEAAIQHGLNPLLKEVSVVEDGKKPVLKVDEEKVEEKKTQPEKKKKKLKANEDIFNIILLLVLYILQGIPSGLTFSVPLILSTRNVSYSDQGTFSFALWPFSIRLLWAPIVDSLSITRIGRRKTWVVGCFITVGLIMVSFAQYVNNILQADREKNSTDIYILTLIFGTLVFLIATQDIALDAWSLDLLMHKNVGWQSICNSVGIGIGGFMGGALFLTLESVKFSNQFIRPLFKLEPQNYGVFTIKQFCYTFGIVSIVTGLLILFFKSEHSKRKLKKSLSAEEGDTTNALPSKRSILINYKLVWSLLKLSAIRKLIFIFLTVRIGFASEHVVRLKLVELGVEREKISILSVLIAPILTALPFVVKKYINGPKPLDLFRSAYVYKMLMLIIVILFTYYVPYFKDDVTGAFTYTFYILFFVISLVSSMISFVSWVSVGGFCAKISDKTIGGTYLTFLGFWLSLGSNWSKTACLYLISWLTFKQCVYIGPRSSILANNATSSIVSSNNQNVTLETAAISNNKCSSNLDQKKCTQSGGYCITTFDGFYIISLSLLFIALLWLILTRRMIDYLQILPKSAWCVSLPSEQSTPTPTPTSLDDDESDDGNEAKKTNKK